MTVDVKHIVDVYLDEDMRIDNKPVTRRKVAVIKGSEYSGNYGHAGRPGKVGGSAPGGGAPSKSDLIKAMKDGRWSVLRDFNYTQGTSASAVVQLENDGKAIIKPDTVFNGQTKDELTYDIARELGWNDLIPLTTTSNKIAIFVSEQPGTVQAWVDDSEPVYNFVNRYPPKYAATDVDAESFVQIALLDAAIDNEDRHAGNLLIQEIGGKAVARAIDHNLAYHYTETAISTRSVFIDGIDHYISAHNAIHVDNLNNPNRRTNKRLFDRDVVITPTMRENSAKITKLFNSNNPTTQRLAAAFGNDWVELAAKRTKWIDGYMQSESNMGWLSAYISMGTKV